MERCKHNLIFVLSLTRTLLRNNPYYTLTWLFIKYTRRRLDGLLSNSLSIGAVSDQLHESLINANVSAKHYLLTYAHCALVKSGDSRGISSKKCAYVCSKISRKKYKIFILPYDDRGGDEKIIVSETMRHNITNALNHDLDDNSYFVMPVDEEFIPIATEADISMISNSHDCSDESIDRLLRTYFGVPRYARTRDIFVVGVKEYAPHCFYSFGNNYPEKIYFRVNNLKIERNSIAQSTSGGCYVVKGETRLSRSTHVFARLPSQFFENPIIETGSPVDVQIEMSSVPNCPPFLEKLLSELSACVAPFLKRDPRMKIRPVFLVKGPPGSGKYKLIECLAKRNGLHLLNVDFSEIQCASAAQTEAKLRIILQNARSGVPCILRLSNIQIFGKNADGKKDERIIDAFACEMEKLSEKKTRYPMIVIATLENDDIEADTERLFVETIRLHHPDKSERAEALSWFLKTKGILYRGNLTNIAGLVSDFELADLEALVVQSAKIAYRLSPKENYDIRLTLTDDNFIQACELMQNSFCDRIGAPRIPKVHWEDIGGLANLKHEIKRRIELPMTNTLGLGRSGLVLYGPPGTGKTLLAKAVATECQLHFTSIKGPELLNMYVGQSEKNVRQVFERARAAAPCVIFFDELDSLAPNRGRSGDSGGVMDRVVSQLLAEMDGLDSGDNIFVIAATNRLDLIDPALLRPGRFDKTLYVGIYDDRDSQLRVLQAVTRRFRMRKNGRELEDVIDKLPKNLTGADLHAVCSDAWLFALRRYFNEYQGEKDSTIRDELLKSNCKNGIIVGIEDFEEALKNLAPSLSNAELERYEKMKMQFSLTK